MTREPDGGHAYAPPDSALFKTALDAIGEAVLVTTPDLDAPGPVILYANPAFSRMTGYTREEVIGRSPRFLHGPETDRTVLDHVRESLSRGAAVQGETVNYRKDGSTYRVEWLITPMRDGSGDLTHWIAVQRDITSLRQTEAALRVSEERFRQFSEASSDLVWMRNAETLQLEYVSPAFERIYKSNRELALADTHINTWLSFVHPEDRGRVIAGVQQARTGVSVTYEFRTVGISDGGSRWIESTAFPLPDAEGRVRRIGGIAKDISEQKANAARLEVMVAELQHRTCNLLAVVRSIAMQTLIRTGPTEAFTRQFSDRLSALSRVQGLLSRSEQAPITILMLIQTELDALSADAVRDRVVLEGPSVRLRKAAVQTLALALHELATNARKYGALSSESGRLSVSWQTHKTDAGQRRLVLDWVEEGIKGPCGEYGAVVQRGYGRELIEQALPYALRALTSYVLSETDLRCRIDLPLS